MKSLKAGEKLRFSGREGDGSVITCCKVSMYVLVERYGYLPVAVKV